MMVPKGPPAKGAGGPIPSADALGTVEETPLATAGGTSSTVYNSDRLTS